VGATALVGTPGTGGPDANTQIIVKRRIFSTSRFSSTCQPKESTLRNVTLKEEKDKKEILIGWRRRQSQRIPKVSNNCEMEELDIKGSITRGTRKRGGRKIGKKARGRERVALKARLRDR